MGGDLTVRLLGPFETVVDGRPVVVPSGRQRILLAALALSAGQVVPVDRLAEWMWESRPPLDLRNGIHNVVWRLRRLLGTDAIVAETEGYRLDLAPADVDALRLVDLERQAAQADPASARELLAEAVSLWRGDPLSGVVSDSLHHDHAPALVECYLSVVERQADVDDMPARIALLRDLLRRHPFRESLWDRLLAGLCRLGRQAEALAEYERVRSLLSDSLGTDPSAALQSRHQQILAMGNSAPDRPPAVTPPTTGWSAPAELPPVTADFAGRAQDLAALDHALTAHPPAPDQAAPDQAASGRMSTIIAVHGAGGMGKTTLAVQWAHRIADRFPDGQLYLDMRGYGPDAPVSPGVALDQILRTLGAAPDDIPAGAPQRSALLRTMLAGRRVLILADNIRDADQVRPLVAGGGNLVLVTSRSDLRGLAVRDGAALLELHELIREDSHELARQILGNRASQDALAELVEVCGGVPLALVIAAQRAARRPAGSLAESVAELRATRHRLDTLADPSDPLTDPRTVLSWSYRALEAEPARAFRLLGLHPTPEISLPAAAALLDTTPVAARLLLDRLDAVHLLHRQGSGDYRLHDLLWLFAAERADREGVDEHAVPRLLDWYVDALRRARTVVFAATKTAPPDATAAPPIFADAREATAWYRRHRVTLIAVTEWALAVGADRHCQDLALALTDFQHAQQNLDELHRVADAATAAARRSGDDADRGRALWMKGRAWNALGSYAEANDYQERAYAAARDGSDTDLIASILAAKGLNHSQAGQPELAFETLAGSVEAAARRGKTIRLAHSLLNLAVAEYETGRTDESIAHSHQALDIYRRENVAYQQCLVLANLAEDYLDLGRIGAAMRYADEALALLPDLPDGHAVPNALIARGRVLAAAGDPAGARHDWLQARDRLSEVSPRRAEIDGLLAGL